MAWSVASTEPSRKNHDNPSMPLRVLRVDDSIVSRQFYHPQHGTEFLTIVSCCESDPQFNIEKHSVSVRSVGDAIAWMPPNELILWNGEDSDGVMSQEGPIVRQSPIWFRRVDYARFVSEAGLVPDEQLDRIRPLTLGDSGQILRHAYLRYFEPCPGMPTWKAIAGLVLATEFRPADAPFNALCLQAAEARMHGATIVEVIGEPEGMDLHLVEHLDRAGFPEFAALAFRIRGEALETWAPVGNSCWGRLAF